MKISETGRSMVEMLGVLAIIGVITVGAMIGYRYAMERIMTNSIITGVRARAIVIGQQRVLGHPLNLSEFHPDTEKDLIYGHFEVKAFNNYVYDGEERQALEVYNIPKRVCEKIQDTEFPDDHITLVNKKEVGDTPQPCIPDGPTENTGNIHNAGDYFTAEYHNTVTFVFMDLEDVECESSEQCAFCHSCIDGFCTPDENGAHCGGPSGGCCMGGRCLPLESPACRCITTYGDDPLGRAYACCLEGYTEGTKEWTCCLNPNDLVCQPPVDKCAGVTCDDCMRCDSDTGTCVLDATQNGQACGSNGCSVCENGSCLNKMTQIKKCDGTEENCCPLTAICTDETDCPIECTETPGICQKCNTTTGRLVPDKEGESCGTCGTCTNGECQDSSIGNYYDPSETPSTKKCCAANSVPIGGWGDVKYPGSDNQWSIETTFCCPAGTKSWAANESKLNRCCAGDAVTKTGTSRSYCCPTGSKYVAKNGDCCSYDPLSTGSYLNPSDGSDVCCPENSVIEQVASSSSTKDYCCPAGTKSWAKNEEGAARCCAQKNVRGYCCPEGTEYAIQGTCCDSNTMGVLYDPAQNPSPEMCCPTGSVKINARGTGTSHNSSETGLIDFCCPAGTTRWAPNEEGAARCCNGTVLNGKCYEPGEDLCADITCGDCEVCQEGKCVSNGDSCCGVSCGACKECQNGQCVDAGTTVITKCDGTTETCCSWNGTHTCKDEDCSSSKCTNNDVWDTSEEAKNYYFGSRLASPVAGQCCPNDNWNGQECCAGSDNYWTQKETEGCCESYGGIVCPNGRCITTGCCDDALPKDPEAYHNCYKCNEETHKWYLPENMRWCPKSKTCTVDCCTYGFSNCCRDATHMDHCWGPTWKYTCEAHRLKSISGNTSNCLTSNDYSTYKFKDQWGKASCIAHKVTYQGRYDRTGSIGDLCENTFTYEPSATFSVVNGDGSQDVPAKPSGKPAKYYETIEL